VIEDVLIDPDDPLSRRWTELALRFHVENYLFHSLGDPAPGSPFNEANVLFQWEKASDWCREYLSAALQSASMWADHHAPLSFNPVGKVLIRPRPVQSLARATLESAAQAVWVMTADNPHDLVVRHLRLMHGDYVEQKKAFRLHGDRVDLAEEQLSKFKQRVGTSFDESTVFKDVTYLATIRGAAEALSGIGKPLSPDETEYVWRLASASTHGKRWAIFELNDVENLEEYEPGQLRVARTARLDVAFRAMATAFEIAHFGVAVFAARSGLDYFAAQNDAVRRVAEEIPVKAGHEVERQELVDRLSSQPNGGASQP
jgi:hypothetical protein